MEIGVRVFLLAPLLLAMAAPAAFGQSEPSEDGPRVIEPEVERRAVNKPQIDTENWEVGGYAGVLSIEDFGSNPVYGIRADYHITEDFFFEANVGRSTAGKTSFETLGGDVTLLPPGDRRLTYYNLSLGYNLLPGEVYLGRNIAMNSSLYLIGGVGATEFAGDQHFTINFGAGYRLLPTDWLAIHVDVQDLMFQSDLLGESKLANNLGAWLGFTVFF
ncbi:MAG: outer membrane beta-barrel domain-containing protein [Nevskiaceae bacterium]|jgi:outer membrane beta-barrel protein|nr:outer membrane beta-barrel domain-containing protein [Nevskiaceae bacterium]